MPFVKRTILFCVVISFPTFSSQGGCHKIEKDGVLGAPPNKHKICNFVVFGCGYPKTLLAVERPHQGYRSTNRCYASCLVWKTISLEKRGIFAVSSFCFYFGNTISEENHRHFFDSVGTSWIWYIFFSGFVIFSVLDSCEQYKIDGFLHTENCGHSVHNF